MPKNIRPRVNRLARNKQDDKLSFVIKEVEEYVRARIKLHTKAARRKGDKLLAQIFLVQDKNALKYLNTGHLPKVVQFLADEQELCRELAKSAREVMKELPRAQLLVQIREAQIEAEMVGQWIKVLSKQQR
ncbi:MAG: hypothetical protein WDN47_02115 [Candidatus Doudnabacteria bacterium]